MEVHLACSKSKLACCFKPLSLWKFVTVAIENQYSTVVHIQVMVLGEKLSGIQEEISVGEKHHRTQDSPAPTLATALASQPHPGPNQGKGFGLSFLPGEFLIWFHLLHGPYNQDASVPWTSLSFSLILLISYLHSYPSISPSSPIKYFTP